MQCANRHGRPFPIPEEPDRHAARRFPRVSLEHLDLPFNTAFLVLRRCDAGSSNWGVTRPKPVTRLTRTRRCSAWSAAVRESILPPVDPAEPLNRLDHSKVRGCLHSRPDQEPVFI